MRWKDIFCICSVYIATVVGAGFATGQEIITYFLSKGSVSIFGVMLAALLFCFASYSVLNRVKTNGINLFSEYLQTVMPRFLSGFTGVLTFLFLFSGFCVMISAGATILADHYRFSKFWAGLILCLVCYLIFLKNIGLIVKINGVLAPIMICGIFLSCLAIIFGREETATVFACFNTNGISGFFKNNFVFSALLYVSYNLLSAVVILVPLRVYGKDSKTIAHTSLISGGILLVLLGSLWMVLKIYYGKVPLGEIPMLDVLGRIGAGIKNVYSLILLMAIFTTAVGNGYGFTEWLCGKTKLKKPMVAAILCLGAMVFNFFQFSKLVQYVYGLFGAAGLCLLVCIILDGIRILKIKMKK
jgi:uncharacterized membrane protein YkvI